MAAESYTHENWVYRNVYVNFSRLYYILDGEGYYTENGQTRRFKKNHIYLTPVRKSFTICDNPHDKILHTYSHITTTPIVDHLIELEVKEGSPLADAVALWRKYLYTTDIDLLKNVIQFLLSCIDNYHTPESALAERIKAYIDHHAEFEPDMVQISHALGYSREHITRSFMTIYHQTPKQYCNQKK